MKVQFATAVLALGTLSFAAHAQTAAPQAAPSAAPAPTVEQAAGKGGPRSEEINKMRQACATDVQKFCANVEKGKGKMRACLDQHDKDLSATCKEARAARAANPQSKGKG